MPFELRIDGKSAQIFDTEEEAIARAREAIQMCPDSEPEIWDTTSGKPVAPGASKEWRDELARKIGF